MVSQTASASELLLKAFEKATKSHPLGAELTRKIWLFLVKNYLENKISEHDLFSLSTYILYTLNEPNKLSAEDGELMTSLCFSAEWLFWYKHKNNDEKWAKEHKTLGDFYEKNKHHIGE